jgi:hypothetical protein
MAEKNYLIRDTDVTNTGDIPPVRTPVKAAPPSGDESIDQPGGNQYGGNNNTNTAPAAAQPNPASSVDVTQPNATKTVSDMLANGSLVNSPYYQQILENQQKLIALRAQPTYVNKRGETVNGMKDQDGRIRSGLKAVIENLAQPRQIRNWGDLGGMLAGGAGAGVAGAIAPEWNEQADRQREIQRLENETEHMIHDVQQMGAITGREVNQNLALGRLQNSNAQLTERKARNSILNMKTEQQTALAPIMKRGYYYEGDNPDEDAKLKSLNIVLPDFDSSRKPINDNGVRKSWNPQTRSYEQQQGTDVDPDEQPMTFEVDGKPITASTKWFINYAGAKERQQSQQTFQTQQQQRQFEQQDRVQAANKQFTAPQLTNAMTKYASDNMVTLEQAKEAFRKAGVDVDGILKRQ